MTNLKLISRQEILSILFLSLLFANILFGQQTSADSMIVRINGHEHKVKDIFSAKVNEVYDNQKDKIKNDIKQEIENTQSNASLTLQDITMPDNINLI